MGKIQRSVKRDQLERAKHNFCVIAKPWKKEGVPRATNQKGGSANKDRGQPGGYEHHSKIRRIEDLHGYLTADKAAEKRDLRRGVVKRTNQVIETEGRTDQFRTGTNDDLGTMHLARSRKNWNYRATLLRTRKQNITVRQLRTIEKPERKKS